MRALAVGTQDGEAAALMLKLAEDYDKLADRVRIRAQEQAESKKNNPGDGQKKPRSR
jgi:hypothetical protein